MGGTIGIYKILLDGQETTSQGYGVSFAELLPGPHSLQISRLSYNKGRVIKHWIYNGAIHLPANTQSYVTVLNGANGIRINRVVAYTPPAQHPEKPLLFLDPKLPMGYVNNPYGHYEPYEEPCTPLAMSATDFAQLQNTIRHASFESTKMSILKQASAFNYFTTDQVCQLLREFWFDSSKLEAAKLVYPKTTDPNNFYRVNNSFSFSSSVDALGQFIAMR